MPAEILFTDLSNHFPVFKTTTTALGKPHFNDQLIHYKSVITSKYIQSLIINLSMAADAERMERVAATCVVFQKIRDLFNNPKKMKSLSAVRYVRCWTIFPSHYFISKKLKNWNLKTSLSRFPPALWGFSCTH